MTLRCPTCLQPVAKEDRRRRNPRLEPTNGATVELFANQAPRIKCACGKVIILVRAST